MEYNFLKREVYMPTKYFRKDRHIRLSKRENLFFATLWFSKDHTASYEELNKNVYDYEVVEMQLLRSMANRLRRKKIEIVSIYNYGYQLKITD